MLRKTKINANFVSYLLNIFDGKLSYTDITTMPLSRLLQLQKIKEDELEHRSKQIQAMQQNKNEEGQMTVNNKGKRYKDKSGNVSHL